jgi:hypothetical protein
MVSIWLTRLKGWGETSNIKKIGLPRRSRFSSNVVGLAVLLAILLDAGGAQSREPMLIDGELPGEEFVNRQGVTAASLLQGEQATTNRGDDFGFTADNPPFGAGRRQIRNR